MILTDVHDQSRLAPRDDGRTSDIGAESLALPLQIGIGTIDRFVGECEGIANAVGGRRE